MQPGMNQASDLLMMIVVFMVVGLAVALVIAIFYLLTLQKALNRVAPHNRLMEPATVWFMLIPCFNLIWQFFIATRLPDSLRNEFKDRGLDDGSDYGKSIALTRAVLGLVSLVVSNVASRAEGLQQVGSCASLAMSLIELVLFIVFWVKVANYSRQLADDGRRHRRDYDFDLDPYDRDRPRGGPSTPSPETYRPDDAGYRP